MICNSISLYNIIFFTWFGLSICLLHLVQVWRLVSVLKHVWGPEFDAQYQILTSRTTGCGSAVSLGVALGPQILLGVSPKQICKMKSISPLQEHIILVFQHLSCVSLFSGYSFFILFNLYKVSFRAQALNCSSWYPLSLTQALLVVGF